MPTNDAEDLLYGDRTLSLVAWPAATSLALTLFIPSRPDRTGHFLAGFGATLLVAWLVALVARGHLGAVVLATVGCVGIGHLVEMHVFPLGGYDLLDVSAQSVGAVLAGCALLLGRAGEPEVDAFDAASLSPSSYGRAIVVVGVFCLVLGGWRAFS